MSEIKKLKRIVIINFIVFALALHLQIFQTQATHAIDLLMFNDLRKGKSF